MRGKTPWEDGRAVLTTRWEARYGPIPPGHRLVRICDRSRCVNLDHAVLLDPGQAQVYRYAGTERIWLGQEEADEIHALITDFAARNGISLGAAVAYARWPHGLAEALAPRNDPPSRGRPFAPATCARRKSFSSDRAREGRPHRFPLARAHTSQ